MAAQGPGLGSASSPSPRSLLRAGLTLTPAPLSCPLAVDAAMSKGVRYLRQETISMGLLPCLTKVRTTHRLTGPAGGKGPASACTVPSSGGVGARSACRSRHTALSGTATRSLNFRGKRRQGLAVRAPAGTVLGGTFGIRVSKSAPSGPTPSSDTRSPPPPGLRLRNPPDRTHRALPGPGPRTPGARQPSSHPRTHARGSSPPLPFPHAPVPSRALSLDRHQRPPQPAKTYSIRHYRLIGRDGALRLPSGPSSAEAVARRGRTRKDQDSASTS